jgi:hypothetical protein
VQEIARSFMQQTILASNFLQQTIIARSFMQRTILARRFMPHQLWQWDLANLETGTYIKVLVHVGFGCSFFETSVSGWVGVFVCKFFSCII